LVTSKIGIANSFSQAADYARCAAACQTRAWRRREILYHARMADVDVTIIGGGVVGLSLAYELARRGRAVALLEKHARFGEETSTHNSGVIHAGIYYPAGSLKARLCVAGRDILAERLAAWRVPHRFGGKLIVATDDDELPMLEELLAKGRANGVAKLEPVDAGFAKKREPNISCRAALFSPGTGVFDVGAYLHQLAGRATAAGALLLTGAEVTAVDRDGAQIEVHTAAKGNLTCGRLVNAAGLWADRVAEMCGENGHQIHPCRGEYAAVVPRRAGLVQHLVYPVPVRLSLGVHLTRTVDGELWVGPDAKYISAKDDYETARRPLEEFLVAAQKLCPALTLADLRFGQAGIRPKRYGPDEAVQDWHVALQHDDVRLIHLVGIESPGLTASPALAGFVADWLDATD
jgi:L-2-hydroxyglutarate oxidase LhgO